MAFLEDDPQYRAWRQDIIENLLPMLADSAVVVSIVPEDQQGTDVKFAVELGFSIMMDKPIIAIVSPGTKVPAKLAMVADVIVEGKISAPDFPERMRAAIAHVTVEYEARGG